MILEYLSHPSVDSVKVLFLPRQLASLRFISFLDPHIWLNSRHAKVSSSILQVLPQTLRGTR